MNGHRKRIEHLTGTGQIQVPNGPSLEVSYRIDAFQDVFEPPPRFTPVKGLKNYVGVVSGLNEGQLWDLQDQDLTLILQDGRKLPIALQPDGRIIVRGELA